ncbi:hypothetical protein [Piscirickettsia salmonis]|uniref:hypothetical protein n=1 Tax=Piscirickettsia salmonis TaxID=1238 RepID=UPI0007C90230|nr:hypothetical protein A0O36_00594 [Piscirickettsiaceae bacterium NZ-RLO1]
MPQIELKYSDDLIIDTNKIFEAIESTINEYDSSSGVCKSRAYATSLYKHTHILVSVFLLKKPHRDDRFSQGLTDNLEQAVKEFIQQKCYFSLSLEYNSDFYITNQYCAEKNC